MDSGRTDTPGTAATPDDAHRLRGLIADQARLYRAVYPNRAAWTYTSFADLILDLGTDYEPVDWPGGRAQGPAGSCFANATEYAWCATQPGRAIDPSISDGRVLAYLGVALTANYRREQQATRGTSVAFTTETMLADDNHAALSGGIPAHAFYSFPHP